MRQNTLHDAITEMSHKWHAIIKVSVCMCLIAREDMFKYNSDLYHMQSYSVVLPITKRTKRQEKEKTDREK